MDKKTDPKDEALRKKYSRILDLHPRESNLETIDKVYEFLKAANKGKKKEYFRVGEIIRAIPDEDARIIKRSVAKLDEANYLDLFRGGTRFVYFAAEKKDGTFTETIPFYKGDIIDKFKKENFDKIIQFYETHSGLLNNSLILELERVRVSKDLKHANWTAYNALVQNAWNNGFDEFLKLSIRSGAKRYSAK